MSHPGDRSGEPASPSQSKPKIILDVLEPPLIPLKAIPTTYRGIDLKSRLEAQCAYMLDCLQWRWEYEPISLMLGNGIPYTPDFVIRDLGLAIECRGYDTPKGAAQIDSFRSSLDEHGFSLYMALGPGRQIQITQRRYGCGDTQDADIGFCRACHGFRPCVDGRCQACTAEIFYTLGVCLSEGKIGINGTGSENWDNPFSAAEAEFLDSYQRLGRVCEIGGIRRFWLSGYTINPYSLTIGDLPTDDWARIVKVARSLFPELGISE